MRFWRKVRPFIFLFLFFAVLFFHTNTVFAQCAGLTKCAPKDKWTGECLVDQYFDIGCGGSCGNEDGCPPEYCTLKNGCATYGGGTPSPTSRPGGYNYTDCPSGTSLSCGSADEAEQQNKTMCGYRATCDKYYWPSSIGLPAPCNQNNPVSATCSWNCSCCPIGSSRTCTTGGQYFKNVTIDVTNGDPVANDVAIVTCNTHDDIFISHDLINNYWVGEDHLKDYKLRCRTQTCNCQSSATPTPTRTPTPTNTPVPPTPTNTPVPVGTIWARAVQVDPNNTSCADVFSVPTTDGQINNTTHQFTPSSASQPAAQTQSGANFVVFSNVTTGSYTLDPNPPSADWVLSRACWRNLAAFPQQGEGMTATLGGGQTLRFDMGYTLGTAWVQTQGGDVYAAGTIRSYLPAVTPRVFNKDGVAGYPGVVMYGTGYDFDSDPFATGDTLISSTDWQVNDSRPTVDYYDFFYRRFGSPTTPTIDPAFSNPLAVTKPPSSAVPYYVTGDMTTSGNWTVGDGEAIIIIVDGNLTLDGSITITGGGFIAFIVRNNITVNSTVGTPAASTTPVVEGVYITSPTGTFATGESVSGAAARFVGRGMFVAGNFLLQRDLDGMGGGGNITNAAELFVYHPRLLITMPEAMRELSVTWQEVAP